MENWLMLSLFEVGTVLFFTTGGSINQTQITLACQSRQAIFKINK